MRQHLGLATISGSRGVRLAWVLGLWICLWTGLLLGGDAVAAGERAFPNVAFYLGSDAPLDLLQAFDEAIVDPAVFALPSLERYPHTRWAARVEITPQDYQGAPEAWVKKTLTPLWAKGFRDFYLTDEAGGFPNETGGISFSSASPTAEDRWLSQALTEVHGAFGVARIFLRNHPLVADAQAGLLAGWVVESIFQPYDPQQGWFLTVDPHRLDEQLGQLHHWQEKHPEVPLIDLELAQKYDREGQQALARKSAQAGLIPYVTSPDEHIVGIGKLTVMPRKILVVQSLDPGVAIEEGTGSKILSLPLDYLGYDVRYVNVNEGLPEDITPDRYAGIAVFLDKDVEDQDKWRLWFLNEVRRHVPVAVFDRFGFDIDLETAQALDLKVLPSGYLPGATVKILHTAPMIGFEHAPQVEIQDAVGLAIGPSGQSLAQIQVGDKVMDMAATLPWGGYALAPFSLEYVGELNRNYWVIDPLKFLRQALSLPAMPVPDTTSENGRRLLFVQVDGDGFPSRAEFPGYDYGAEALYDQIFKKYPIPMTVSVVEGEIGPTGKYPALSPTLESIARKIFALPNIEIGSHTYSHPLDWILADPSYGQQKEQLSMQIPGYTFDLKREIEGSIDYINSRLAPPGKKVRVLQWSGAANPTAAALEEAWKAGVYNINGGDTLPVKPDGSWTDISGAGIAKGKGDQNYQIYAAEMNENIYTNDWTRPFYGMVRVLETYEITEFPLRIKPVDIYFHFYSGTKLASLKALQNVYDVTLKQPVFPVYTSDFIQKVLDARHASVALQEGQWQIRTGRSLREFRLPVGEIPDLARSAGVVGYLPVPGGTYLHLGDDQARVPLVSASSPSDRLPYVSAATAYITHFERQGRTIRFDARGYYQPYVLLGHVDPACRFKVDGQAVQPTEGGKGRLKISFPSSGGEHGPVHGIEVHCHD